MSDYKYYTPIALLDVLLNYLPPGKVSSVVDISCGPFNLLKSALKKYPEATFVGVDTEDQNTEDCPDIRFVRQDGRLFAKQQNRKKQYYDLILTNPPFGKLQKKDRLFENAEHAILCSRYECEMMYANSLLAHEGSRIIAILPATFIEGDLYEKYRKQMAKEYEIHTLIKLPGNVFSKGEISAYAVILCKTISPKANSTHIGYATFQDEAWHINITNRMNYGSIISGRWISPNISIVPDKKISVDKIYRGNVSSTSFSSHGAKILHCSSIFDEGLWQPAQHYCKDVPNKELKYVQTGDIIINRIGKNAGYWTRYSGERQLISDCLIVVRGGYNAERYLSSYSVKGRLAVPIKGVATKYISISDLLRLYFSVPNSGEKCKDGLNTSNVTDNYE